MNKVLRDWQFYLCLVLGPVSWWLISFAQPVRGDLGMPDFGISQAPWYQLALIILIYPILEEIVFRGLLLEFLTKRIRYRVSLLTAANVLTSLVFVMAHLIYSEWVWALLIFFPSLVFGYMKERHQSLIAPIMLHSFYNLGFVWLFSA